MLAKAAVCQRIFGALQRGYGLLTQCALNNACRSYNMDLEQSFIAGTSSARCSDEHLHTVGGSKDQDEAFGPI